MAASRSPIIFPHRHLLGIEHLSAPDIIQILDVAEEAVALVVNGFVKDVLQQLPMEFAVEAQKLISISLEGSVG